MTGEMDTIQICHRCFSCAVGHKKMAVFSCAGAHKLQNRRKNKKIFVFVCDKDRKKWSCTRILRFSVVLAFFSCTIRSGLSEENEKNYTVQSNMIKSN